MAESLGYRQADLPKTIHRPPPVSSATADNLAQLVSQLERLSEAEANRLLQLELPA